MSDIVHKYMQGLYCDETRRLEVEQSKEGIKELVSCLIDAVAIINTYRELLPDRKQDEIFNAQSKALIEKYNLAK